MISTQNAPETVCRPRSARTRWESSQHSSKPLNWIGDVLLERVGEENGKGSRGGRAEKEEEMGRMEVETGIAEERRMNREGK